MRDANNQMLIKRFFAPRVNLDVATLSSYRPSTPETSPCRCTKQESSKARVSNKDNLKNSKHVSQIKTIKNIKIFNIFTSISSTPVDLTAPLATYAP